MMQLMNFWPLQIFSQFGILPSFYKHQSSRSIRCCLFLPCKLYDQWLESRRMVSGSYHSLQNHQNHRAQNILQTTCIMSRLALKLLQESQDRWDLKNNYRYLYKLFFRCHQSWDSCSICGNQAFLPLYETETESLRHIVYILGNHDQFAILLHSMYDSTYFLCAVHFYQQQKAQTYQLTNFVDQTTGRIFYLRPLWLVKDSLSYSPTGILLENKCILTFHSFESLICRPTLGIILIQLLRNDQFFVTKASWYWYS